MTIDIQSACTDNAGAIEPLGPMRSHADAFLDRLYSAALEAADLPAALSLFSRAFDCRAARIYASNELLAVPCAGVDWLTNSAERQILDILENWQPASRCGALSGTILPTGRHQSLGGPDTSTNYLALLGEIPGSGVVAFVGIRRRSFSEEDRHLAQNLARDFQRAMRFHHEARCTHAIALAEQLFAASTIALAVTRRKCVEQTNEMADRQFGSGGLVTLFGRMLTFKDVRVQAGYELLSRPDFAGSAQAPRVKTFVAPDDINGETWLIQIARLAISESSLSLCRDRAPLILVAVTPLRSAAASREWSIAGLGELTGMERTILSGFVDGKDLGAIATDLGRSVQTVRWHVKNLFTKLNVNSHRDLARLGALLLPI